MASDLTSQVRGMAKVVTAVAMGDLKQKLAVEAKGEIAALADTINSMIATLATFADQVTTVAREVGMGGELGGEAKVPGAAGTWKALPPRTSTRLPPTWRRRCRPSPRSPPPSPRATWSPSIKVEALGEVAIRKDKSTR